MLLRSLFLACVLVSAGTCRDARAYDRPFVRVVGSTGAFAVATYVAEEFARSTRSRVPVVEATGTGSGFRLFCSGVGPDTPDVNMASRKMGDVELLLCNSNEVKFLEVQIGVDALLLVSGSTAPARNIEIRDLFNAISYYVVHGSDEVTKNDYTVWSEINPAFPGTAIEVYAALRNTATGELLSRVLRAYCLSSRAFYRAFAKVGDASELCGLSAMMDACRGSAQ